MKTRGSGSFAPSRPRELIPFLRQSDTEAHATAEEEQP